MKKNLTIILITAIAVVSFVLGRASVKQTHEVIYTKGKEMQGNVQVSLPTKEIQPVAPLLPYRYIFIDNTKTEIVDTAKIISDYIAQRTYSLTLFDNLYGRLDISPTIQYNQLAAVPYSFTPIEKTIYSRQKFTFFSTLSYNTFGIAGVGVGLFYNNVGVHYKYLWHTHLQQQGHEWGVGFRF